MRQIFVWALILTASFGFSGCAKYQVLEERNREQAETITGLHQDLKLLNEELETLRQSKDELTEAKIHLEKKLKGELSAGDLELTFKERGLVITFLDRVLFSSGKTELKTSAQETLTKVVSILKETVPGKRIYVEGHTDNVPIRLSGWKSNWELSATRATEVVHFLIEQGVKPSRLAAAGYGEFNPVADNKIAEGRGRNRRVEIIVSPKSIQELLPTQKL